MLSLQTQAVFGKHVLGLLRRQYYIYVVCTRRRLFYYHESLFGIHSSLPPLVKGIFLYQRILHPFTLAYTITITAGRPGNYYHAEQIKARPHSPSSSTYLHTILSYISCLTQSSNMPKVSRMICSGYSDTDRLDICLPTTSPTYRAITQASHILGLRSMCLLKTMRGLRGTQVTALL